MRKSADNIENIGKSIEKVTNILLDFLLGRNRKGKTDPRVYCTCSGKWPHLIIQYNWKRLGLITLAMGGLFLLCYPSGLESFAVGIALGATFALFVAWIEYLRVDEYELGCCGD